MLIPNAKPNWGLGFFTLAIFLMQIVLGLYVYKIKYDVQLDYLKEIRKDVWKEEIRRILSDPEFFQLIREKGNDQQVTRRKRETVAKLKNLNGEDFGNIHNHCIKVQKCDFPDILDSTPIDVRVSDLLAVQPGIPEPQGIAGYPGPKGDAGRDGQVGAPGLSGLPGRPGPVGLPGRPGYPGQKGDQGPRGPPGMNGLGDDIEELELKGNTEHCGKGEIGQPGPPGAPGLPGPKGDDGLLGMPGYMGLKGDRGFVGFPGSKGAKGSEGDKGDQGLPGFIGLDGPRGMKGESGLQGLNGFPGIDGLQGMPGPKGDSGSSRSSGFKIIPVLFGPPKMKGDQGLPGLMGIKGDRGLVGLPGSPGPNGLDGLKGNRGETGFEGLPGRPGDSGLHGYPGMMGALGARGPPGPPGPQGPIGPPALSGQCQPCTSVTNLNKPNVPHITSTTYGGNDKYLDFPLFPSSDDCALVTIQEPTNLDLKIYNNEPYGAWMVDSAPITEADGKKFWVTTTDNYTLFEHDKFSIDPISTYELLVGFHGNNHVVYNGSFFYEESHKNPRIIKYGLSDESIKSLRIPGLTSENYKRIYRGNQSYLDFSVDETGLWVFFAVPDTNNTGVVKVNSNSMTIEKIWNVTLNHRIYDEMFIASGILYPIVRTTEGKYKIDLGFNLYMEKPVGLDLNINGQGEMGPVTYDHRNKQILTWNNGNLTAYPVVCQQMVENRSEVYIQ